MNLPTTASSIALHLSLFFFPVPVFALFIILRSRRSSSRMYTPVGLLAVLALLSAALGLVPGTTTAQRIVHALLSATAGASLLHLLALSTPRHPHFTLFILAPIALLCAATITALLPPTLLPALLPSILAIVYTLSTVPITIRGQPRTSASDAPAALPLSLSFTLPPSPASSSTSFPSTSEKPALSHPPSSWFPNPEARPVARSHNRIIQLHVLSAQLASILSSIFALLALAQPTPAFSILSTAFTALSLLAILSAYHRLMRLPAPVPPTPPPTPAYDPYTSPVATPPHPLVLPMPLRSPLRTKIHRKFTTPSPKSPTHTHTRSPPSASSSFFSPWPRPPPLSEPDTAEGHEDQPTPPRAAYTYDAADAYNDAQDVRVCSYTYAAHPYRTSTPGSPASSSSSPPRASARAYPRTTSASASVYTQVPLPLQHPPYPVYPTYTPRHTLPSYHVLPTFPVSRDGARAGEAGEGPDFTDLRDPFASAAPRTGAHIRIVSVGGGYEMVGGKGKARSADGHVGVGGESVVEGRCGVNRTASQGVDAYRAASARGGAGRRGASIPGPSLHSSTSASSSMLIPAASSSAASTASLVNTQNLASAHVSASASDSTQTTPVSAAPPVPRTRMSAWGRLPIPLRNTGAGALQCGTSGGTGTLLLPLAGGVRGRGCGKRRGKGKGKGKKAVNGEMDSNGVKGAGKPEEEEEERLEESVLLAQRLLRSLTLVGGAGAGGGGGAGAGG